jgi:hypothetical protein
VSPPAIRVSGQSSADFRVRENTTLGISFMALADGWWEVGQNPAMIS